MLEVFSRDRELDFEFFVFTSGEIKYRTRDCYEMSKELKDWYHSLEPGTIILDGAPISIDNVTDEQLEYIKDVADSFADKILDYKENYKPLYMRHTSGNSIGDIISNKSIIEVPDPKHFKEWVHIKGFDFIQNFLDEYERQNSKGNKTRSRFINFFR